MEDDVFGLLVSGPTVPGEGRHALRALVRKSLTPGTNHRLSPCVANGSLVRANPDDIRVTPNGVALIQKALDIIVGILSMEQSSVHILLGEGEDELRD